MLKFVEDYQAQIYRTQAFCQKVRELDLLEPIRAQGKTASGEKFSLRGFMAVSRARLKAVPPDKIAQLAKTDELELLYLHLQSMRNFSGLQARLALVQGDNTGRNRELVSGGEASEGGAGRAATH
jgi:hypothetical protein